MIDWVRSNIPPWVFIAIIAHLTVLGTVAYLILLERKIASWVQDRLGPNRVGPHGLLQPIADGLKFIFKEDYRPANADRVLFTLAPAIMITLVIISIAVIPWGGIKQTTRWIDVTGAADPVAAAIASVPNGATIIGTPHISTMGPPYSGPRPPEEMTYTLATVTYQYPFQIAELNIGVLFILAALSLGVYGVVIGGWASNNKYSFLGGLRATANMISYEIPLGLSVLTIVVMFGTLSLGVIVDKQATYWSIHGIPLVPAWNVFCHPLAFVLFLVCIHAEANRAPFDIAEAEQELVGGYHTEYSSMRFALFFLAEYAGMITTSAVCVALFFGGWHIPWLDLAFPILGDPHSPSPAITTSLWVCILRAVVFFAKTMLMVSVFMWVRWSLPRFRFDQIMNLAWRSLIPISLALLLATAVTIYLFGRTERAYLRISGRMAAALLAANLIVLALTVLASRFIPAAPQTNRKIRIPGSRFAARETPLPATVGS